MEFYPAERKHQNLRLNHILWFVRPKASLQGIRPPLKAEASKEVHCFLYPTPWILEWCSGEKKSRDERRHPRFFNLLLLSFFLFQKGNIAPQSRAVVRGGREMGPPLVIKTIVTVSTKLFSAYLMGFCQNFISTW